MRKDKRVILKKGAMEELAEVLKMSESKVKKIKELLSEGKTLEAHRLGLGRSAEELRIVQKKDWDKAKVRFKIRKGL